MNRGNAMTPELESTIDTRQRAPGQEPQEPLVLRWLFPDAGRSPIPLTTSFRIGRHPDCLALLDGEGVSRHHAGLSIDGAEVVLVDSDSRNGTFLNGKRVTRAILELGSVLRIGEWVGVVERGRAPSVLTELAPGLWGGSALASVLAPARAAAAASDLPIIVVGETGAGKEVVSRAIHEWSGRRGPFCAINCAALPQQLVEGELFGYRRGAFTGAERNHIGHFRRAHQGTLLLDEVIELELATQAKLLRVLQEREVVPLGESTPVRFDVRVVVAAQVPLSRAVKAGRFREDLFMRLAGLELELPPLRSRISDIVPLFQRCLGQAAPGEPPRLEGKLVEALCLHRWPGNVRELELTAKRLIAVHGGEPVLRRSHLPPAMLERADASPAPLEPRRRREARELAALLRKHRGNMSKAAAEMNISRSHAYRLLNGQSLEQFLASTDSEG